MGTKLRKKNERFKWKPELKMIGGSNASKNKVGLKSLMWWFIDAPVHQSTINMTVDK